MRKTKRMTIEFTPDEVKEAILEWCLDEEDRKHATVTFDVSARYTGYGMGESLDHVFTGANVKVESL